MQAFSQYYQAMFAANAQTKAERQLHPLRAESSAFKARKAFAHHLQ